MNMNEVVAVREAAKTIPAPDYEKLKELTHYIIRKCGNLPNFGMTLLWKTLYFSDFDHYELFYKSITGESYRKIENGPAPCHIEIVLDSLLKEGKIIQVKGAKYYGRDMKKFIAEKEPELKCLIADEIKVVDMAIQRLKSMTAKQASEYSHIDTPWKVTEDKAIIDYELVFHRLPITSVSETEGNSE